MPKIWILRGIKKGILTSKFPRRAPTPEEVPPSSAPPLATDASDWVAGAKLCPTGAIRESPKKTIELGRCVYCKRCADANFVFAGPGERGIASLQASTAPDRVGEKDIMEELERKRRTFKRSLHILMIDVGSCNACNLEVLNLSNPYYDMTRLGIFFTNSPKHADALIVVGALNTAMVDVLKRTYESMPDPKFVVSVGACAISGGVFHDTESFVSPVQDVLPVDVSVPGCPPSPIQILEGLLLAMGKLEKPSVVSDSQREVVKA
jgi:Ni,Fe-hydrogenase III small subunit